MLRLAKSLATGMFVSSTCLIAQANRAVPQNPISIRIVTTKASSNAVQECTGGATKILTRHGYQVVGLDPRVPVIRLVIEQIHGAGNGTAPVVAIARDLGGENYKGLRLITGEMNRPMGGACEAAVYLLLDGTIP